MTIQRHAASFKEGTAHPLKAFQKMLGLMAAASPVLQLGLLRMRPIQFWLKQRVPSTAWRQGRHRIMVTRDLCVRLLQPLPRPQKRRWPTTYSISPTPESRMGKKVVQDDLFETDPLANMPRGLVHVAGSERCLLSYRVYIECSVSYRKSEQLFVGFGNHAKGSPVTKQRISTL